MRQFNVVTLWFTTDQHNLPDASYPFPTGSVFAQDEVGDVFHNILIDGLARSGHNLQGFHVRGAWVLYERDTSAMLFRDHWRYLCSAFDASYHKPAGLDQLSPVVRCALDAARTYLVGGEL